MADKNENPEIKYRKKMTKYIKDLLVSEETLFLSIIKTFFEYTNAIEGTISAMYGSYSYLSLKDTLKNSDITTTNVKGLNVENVDETMKDLNILIMTTTQNLELCKKSSMTLLEIIKGIIEKYQIKFKTILGYDYKKCEIRYEIKEKVYTGMTLSLFINSDSFNPDEWEPFVTIDIYNLHNPVVFLKQNIFQDDSNGLKILNRDGYIIFSSFYFYYKIARDDVAIGKLRVKNFIETFYKNETEAYECILKCKNLFEKQNKHSIIFRQFLKYMNCDLIDEEGISFKITNVITSGGIIDRYSLTIDGKKMTLREIINSFLAEINEYILKDGMGEMLKIGGEAYCQYIGDDCAVNDIDVKIYIPSLPLKNLKKIYENNMLSLFFLISYFNLEANESHKITLCTFMFAGHQFTYELNTLSSPLQVDCKGIYHTFVYFRIGSQIKRIDGAYTETSYNENLNILDINAEYSEIPDKIPRVYPSVICVENFFKELQYLEDSAKNRFRILTRFSKEKLEKDIERYETLKSLIDDPGFIKITSIMRRFSSCVELPEHIRSIFKIIWDSSIMTEFKSGSGFINVKPTFSIMENQRLCGGNPVEDEDMAEFPHTKPGPVAMPDPHKCQFYVKAKKDGLLRQCKTRIDVTKGQQFCSIHLKSSVQQPFVPPQAQVMDMDTQCQCINNKNKKQCIKPSKNGTQFCTIHKKCENVVSRFMKLKFNDSDTSKTSKFSAAGGQLQHQRQDMEVVEDIDIEYKGFKKGTDKICYCFEEDNEKGEYKNPIDVPPSQLCDLTLAEYLKCKFLTLTDEKIQRLKNLFESSDYVFSLPIEESLLYLTTKLKQIEYSDKPVILKGFNDLSAGKIFLDWYVADTKQYKKINEKLRNKKGLNYVEDTVVTQLKIIISNGFIPEGITLYRGVGKDVDMENNKAFLSCSGKKYIADKFKSEDGDVFEIKVAVGINGLYLPVSECHHTIEDEYLFSPETYILVQKYDTASRKTYYDLYPSNFCPNDSKIQHLKDSIASNPDYKTCTNAIYYLKPFLTVMHENFNLTRYEPFKIILYYLNTTPVRKLDEDGHEISFNEKYERIFSDFIIAYYKAIYPSTERTLIDYLNSITLETFTNGLSIRQLLNTFIATTNKNSRTNPGLIKNQKKVLKNLGMLRKKGGDAVRYYTQDVEEGEKYTNDIDSDFCTNITNEEIHLLMFENMVKSIIFLCKMIRDHDFKIEDNIMSGDVVIGKILSHTNKDGKETQVPSHINLRTNFVGCSTKTKEDKDCVVILSIDISFKVIMYNVFPIELPFPLEFYLKTTPYDLLFIKKRCIPLNINDRGPDLPPIISLNGILLDLRVLLSKPEERKAKHKKDVGRYKALLKKMSEVHKLQKIIMKYYPYGISTIPEKFNPDDIETMKYVIQELISSEPAINLDTQYVKDKLDDFPCKRDDVCKKLTNSIDAIWSGKSYTEPSIEAEINKYAKEFSGIIRGDRIKYMLDFP